MPKECKKCGQPVRWVLSPTTLKWMLWDVDSPFPHFKTCAEYQRRSAQLIAEDERAAATAARLTQREDNERK